MTVFEFEQRVLELEEIEIRIRASRETDVGDYSYQRQAAGTMSVSNWLETRIRPAIDNNEISIVDGSLREPHGRTLLSTLRASYRR